MRSVMVAVILGAAALLLAPAPGRANMPYPGHLCNGKDEGDPCSYGSSRGTCELDPNPPQSCTGNDKSGSVCLWCEFDPNSEEAGCSMAGSASLSGMALLAALGVVALARRRRRP